MADIERVKAFHNNYTTYLDTNKALKNTFIQFRQFLQKYQKNPDSNFNGYDMEGSAEYRKMTMCLQDCITRLDNAHTTPKGMTESFNDLYVACQKYSEKNKRFKSISPNKSGVVRYRVALRIMDQLPLMMQSYNNCSRLFETEKDKKDGKSYSQKSLEDIRVRDEYWLNKYEDDLEDEGDWKKGPETKDIIKLSKEQLKFMKTVQKISKTMAAHYRRDKGLDSYLTMKRNMSMSDKAKYFILKGHLDSMYATGINYHAARNINETFSPDNFKKQYTELSKNPHFINCMKSNPADAYSKWTTFEAETDQLILNLQEEYEELGLKKYAPGIVGQNIDNRGAFGKTSEERKNARYQEIYTDAAKSVTFEILTDPKYRKLAQDVVVNPENKDKLNQLIKKTFEEKHPLKNKTVVQGTDALNGMMSDEKTIKEIVESYNKKLAAEKKLAADNAKKNAQKKSQKNM